MTADLFAATPIRPDLLGRAISPRRELGAYEALWDREGTSFRSIAAAFRRHPDAVPSDFVPERDIERYACLALDAIRAAGIQHIGVRVQGAGDYPERLRDAGHPVALLYSRGQWDLVATRCVAVIGSRQASDAGLRRAAELARCLAADRFTVVSGLARGVDTAVHRAAIDAGGHTMAVLGTPITECYPPENRELQSEIAERCLVISQVPIARYAREDLAGKKRFFPARNATMSALTEATLIVEAGDASGALVQARHALEQGRKVLIMDECFEHASLRWPARLAAQGAIRVVDYGDIRRQLAPTHPDETICDR